MLISQYMNNNHNYKWKKALGLVPGNNGGPQGGGPGAAPLLVAADPAAAPLPAGAGPAANRGSNGTEDQSNVDISNID